jgi:hypothetical protein
MLRVCHSPDIQRRLAVRCSQKGAIVIRNEQVPGSLDAARILASVGEAAYEWRLDTDTLIWSGNAATVLGASLVGIVSGRVFAQRAEAASGQSRFETVTCGTLFRQQVRRRPEDLHAGGIIGCRRTAARCGTRRADGDQCRPGRHHHNDRRRHRAAPGPFRKS